MNKSTSGWARGWIAALAVAGALGWSSAHAGAQKVTLCHVPPGNPDHALTIFVGEPAVDAHLAHGDALGPCPAGCPEPEEATCDDGADNDCDGAVDGADPDCQLCGNGVVEGEEQCDDGNDNPFDGCDTCILVDITPD